MNGNQIENEALGPASTTDRHVAGGVCRFCGSVFDRDGMTSHLKACPKRKSDQGDADLPGSGDETIFHLFVDGGPDYWLHLDIAGDADLSDLDHFLREIWLECCGHMSAFTIEKVRYSSQPMEDYEEKGMSAKLRQVLRPKMKFHHEYDFGTTTLLILKVQSVRAGRLGKKWIRILARNNPPAIPCGFCAKPATKVCPFCIDDPTGVVCDKCRRKHDCREETFMPIVNSPRFGMCGYEGPSREPK